MQTSIQNAAAILGSKGGKSGTGKSKARTPEQCSFAAKKAWESRRKPMPKRFWDNVLIKSPKECWPWLGHTGTKEYGQFWLGGKSHIASRIAWKIENGEIPIGLHVLHKCDNPRCCNPNHLFIGTHTENMRDARQKGRTVNLRGEKHGMAKITDEQARQIRELFKPRIYTRKMLSSQFGISESAIKDIISGRHFSHV